MSVAESVLKYRYHLINNMQVFTQDESEFAGAKTQNAAILVSEIPEQNQKSVNKALFSLEAYGLDSLSMYSASMLDIAQQCPYSGGKAVYQARWFVMEYINDTLQFDDYNTCISQGMLRLQSSNLQRKQNSDILFVIVPNPNKGVFTLKFTGDSSDLKSIDIVNNYNQVIQKILTDAQKVEYLIDLRGISNGIYFVRVESKNGIYTTRKLVIVN